MIAADDFRLTVDFLPTLGGDAEHVSVHRSRISVESHGSDHVQFDEHVRQVLGIKTERKQLLR